MKTLNVKAAFAIAALFILTPWSLVRAQDAAVAGQPASEQEKLQGKWEGVETGHEADGKCIMTITGDAIHFQGANKQEWYKATFTLQPEANPKQLLAKITECSAPDFIGKSSVAIYKVEDGTLLTLTGHKPGTPEAPESFDGDANSRTFVFKKAQAKKDAVESSR